MGDSRDAARQGEQARSEEPAGEGRGRGLARLLTGPQALERLLRREIRALRGQHRAAPEAMLEQPFRIVVPSRSLRDHLSMALARDGACLSVQVQTLDTLAREVLARAGEPRFDGILSALTVRRLAQSEPDLARALDAYEDGYRVVVSAVDDLLDAGFEPVHTEALLERAGELGALAERVRAVVRVAAQAARDFHGMAGHRATQALRARESIEADPTYALPVGRMLIAGFQDATGVHTDLLETLVRVCGAEVLFEQPPVPGGEDASPETAGFGSFGTRLRARLAGLEGCDPVAGEEVPARVELVRAPDREAEVRDLADQIRGLLDAGGVPERIGVVARDLTPYRAALRRHLLRSGVPWSGCGEAGMARALRARLDGLLTLLERGERAGSEQWLDARADLASSERAHLRHVLHRCGAVQLRDLPEVSEDASLASASRSALEALARLPGEATLAAHAAALRAFAEAALGWRAPGRDGTEAARVLAEPLDSASFEVVADERLTREEWSGVLRRALSEAGRDAIGGEGGGVQVLSVTEARSRSFDLLFVLGMNRGVFPRQVVDDPFLPDGLRARLRDVLPELPVKAEGHDEERFLFAQLLASAPRVVLSCAASDAEGSALVTSPLLERLIDAGRIADEREAASLHAPADAAARPPAEHALLAGLAGGHAAQAPLLPFVVGEACAAPRARVVAELDAYQPDSGSGLGPYFGFVSGRRSEPAPYVTYLEAVLRCPWQAYLRRVLSLAPAPDALDALPRVDDGQRLLGNVVHEALEGVVREGLPADPAATSTESHRVAWPSASRVQAILEAAAEHVLARAEVALPGYARVLALRAAPLLDVARDFDWGAGGVDVVGVEWDRAADVPIGGGETREVRFKADRVDQLEAGLRLTDYKTGRPKPPKSAQGEALPAALAERQMLQVAVYAAHAPGAEGRYLHLREQDADDPRERVLGPFEVLPEVLQESFATAFAVHEAGAFIPRLRAAHQDQELDACSRCEVREACLRGDSGARGRLGRFMDGRQAGEGDAALRAATAVWQRELAR